MSNKVIRVSLTQEERRELVRISAIKGLQQCFMSHTREEFDWQCSNCPYFEEGGKVSECMQRLRDDAVWLLKSMEPVKEG